MRTEINMEAFTNAYLAGNEAAQMGRECGLYKMADAAGYTRGSLEWDAYVAGGAAFIFNGHTFKTKAA